MRYIASVSFGKDSLAMLLILIERGEPIDEVVFYNTGVEFDAIYETRDRVLPTLAQLGIRYKELNPKNSMEYNMFVRPVKSRNGSEHNGYSWCGVGGCRWGTSMKLAALDKYCGDNIVYIGLAHDEHDRLSKERTRNKRFPLAEWGITEGEALLYCYTQGFTWMEQGKPLYALLDRVSCWCCGMKNLKELRNYYKYLPKYFEKLEDLQTKTDRPFKKGYTVHQLAERFEKEIKKLQIGKV